MSKVVNTLDVSEASLRSQVSGTLRVPWKMELEGKLQKKLSNSKVRDEFCQQIKKYGQPNMESMYGRNNCESLSLLSGQTKKVVQL